MSLEYRTPIEHFRSVVAEERMTQKTWHREEDGKHYVCLAAAWGKPGTIKSVEDCPVNLFPRWVFELMPSLDDGVAAVDIPWLFQGFSDRAERMAAFSHEQWGRVHTTFLTASIDLALEKAHSVQPSPLPAYWENVEEACAKVREALRSGDGEAAAEAAAGAAAKAAKAAEAAEAEAEAAARTAARTAAKAAEAAAWAAAAAARTAAKAAETAAAAARTAAKAAETAEAAGAAAWAAETVAWAAETTGAAAWKEVASLFFACVDSLLA